MLGDLKEGLRQLWKSPGFAVTALLTLALGIGATTAIFTLVHQVMLKSLPVTKPEELWRIGDKIRCCNWGGYTQGDDQNFALFSGEAYKTFRAGTPEFVDLAALEAGNAPLGVRKSGARSQPAIFNGEYVSGNFFRTLGVGPWIGRVMSDSDDQENAPPVVVMAFHTWREKYDADPSVVGSSYEINGHPFTVIGVTPPGFYGAKLAGWGMPDFYLPLASELIIDADAPRLKRPQENWLDLLGRVRPSVSPKALQAKLRVELHDWLASHVPDMEPSERALWKQQTLHLIPGAAGIEVMRDNYEKGLKLLMIAAGCVLLVACGNLANLMLARGLKDRQQTSIRAALGAAQSRLIRKAFSESILLAILGGILGIGVAYAGSRLILYLAFEMGSTTKTFVPVDATPSWPVLLFALACSVVTGILFGIAPAWMTSRANPVEALRGANRAVGGGGTFAQKALVVGQVAMSLVLLSAAALLARSLNNLEHTSFGFDLRGRYVVGINPTLGSYKAEQMEPLFRRLDERLMRIPGVRMVAPVLYAPLTNDNWGEGIRIQGRPEPPPRQDTGASWARVMPGFFETIGAKIVRGRALNEQDNASSRNVAVVNEAFAKKFFKDQNPIGQHFGINKIKYSDRLEIVGVVNNVRYQTWEMREPVYAMFWVPESQTVSYDDPAYVKGEAASHFLYNIALWAPGDPPNLEKRVREAIASIDPDLVVFSVDSYQRILSSDFQQENMITTLTTLFGLLGLLLAAVGLYGVMAYSVEQRTREIGVRMAIGADRRGVIGMVLRNAFAQVGLGLAIGIPAAIGGAKLMSEQLYEVAPWDPAMLSLAALLLCVAALIASALPASRAASVEPMVALRND